MILRLALVGVLCALVACLSAAAEEPDPVAAWWKLYEEAQTLESAMQWAEAERAYAAAVAFAVRASLNEEALHAAMQGRLVCLDALHRYVDARDLLREMIPVTRVLEDPDYLTSSLLDLGHVEIRLGNPHAAVAPLEEARRRSAASPEAAPRAAAEARLSLAYERLGYLARALDAAQSSVALLASGAGDPVERAEARMRLGALWAAVGERGRARACWHAALEELDDRAREHRTDLLANLAVLDLADGVGASAAEGLEQALARYTARGDAAAAAYALSSLGTVRAEQGRTEEAFRCWEEARALNPTDPHLQTQTLVQAGFLHLAGGQDGPAEETLEAARDGARETLDLHALAHAQAGLARLATRRGDHEHAARLGRAALVSLRQVTSGLSPVGEAKARGEDTRVFDAVLAVAAAVPDPRAGLDVLERCRAAVLLRGAERTAVVDPALADARAATHAAQIRYRAARRAGHRAEAHTARSALHAMQQRYAEELDRVQRDATLSARAVGLATADLAAVRAVLTEEEALVLYATVDGMLLAWVVTHDRCDRVPLGSAADAQDEITAVTLAIQEQRAVDGGAHRLAGLDPRALETVGAWVHAAPVGLLHGLPWTIHRVAITLGASIAKERPGGAETRGHDDAVSVSTLRKRILDPLVLGDEVERLLVSPVGALHFVPWTLLANGYGVALVPSGTVLTLLRKRGSREGAALLALGDPSYVYEHEGTALGVYAGDHRLAPLVATRREIEAICKTADVARSPCVVLLGEEATEGAFRAALAGKDAWRSVHLACHGIVDAARPEWSSLALTPGSVEDGFLTVAELHGMRVPADLVVLSACESGRGRVVRGEGLLGLASAFLLGGARCVVASLWKVDDDATQVLMRSFYEAWWPHGDVPGVDVFTALRRAQDTVRAHPKWRHPRFWAAWVVWGVPK